MKKAILLSGLAWTILLSAGCSVFTAGTVSQADGIDFKKTFHTYQWLPDKCDTLNTAYDNEIIRSNIRHGIDKEMAARHLTAAADGQADVALQLVVQTRDRANDYTRFTPGFYFGPFGGSYSHSRTYYTHDRITLNVYDQKTNRLVWICTVEGDLHQARELNKNIGPAVKKIMDKYPVPPA
jgi:hypothetical protein